MVIGIALVAKLLVMVRSSPPKLYKQTNKYMNVLLKGELSLRGRGERHKY